jgi:hypothetical protein
MDKNKDVDKRHFKLTKRNVLIAIFIFCISIGLPMLILAEL